MPERNNEFGKFGASGVRGSKLVGRRLDDLAGGIATPVTAKRGLMARLKYLTIRPRPSGRQGCRADGDRPHAEGVA